ncbi:MAG: response regulator transcription factor [Clostridiales bacterium]|nr:response regulator transcription factor [Clostridiales bacterium]
MAYNILIVDDQKMQRIALQSSLSENPDYHVVDAIGNAELAISFADSRKIDLIVMDIVMTAGLNGIEAAARIKKDHPEIKIILVTSMPEVSYVEKAKEAGVEGMWYKEYEVMPLVKVIERVLGGEKIIPESTPVLTIGNASSTDFTARELDVLRKVVYGYTDQEIADALNMSRWTVRSHVNSLMQKTGFKNRVELAVNVRSSGLVIDE